MKWRSVNKELPSDLQEVLFYAENETGTHEIMTGHRQNDIWHHCCLFYSTMALNENVKVTHWMPLPGKPEYKNIARKR
jgi:hypothetical protein